MSSQSSPTNPDGYLFFSHNKNNVAPLAVSPSHLWSIAHPKNEVAEAKIFYGQIKNSSDAITAVVSLGDEKFVNGNKNVKREIVRKAVATGVQQLRAAGARNVAIDLDTTKMDPQAAGVLAVCRNVDVVRSTAVGATLGLYKFTTLRTKENDKTPKVDVRLLSENDASGWDTGLIYAQSQNFARELMELPANIVTPTNFCQKVKQAFEGIPNVQIYIRDAAWAEEKGMRTFLSVAKGSAEPCKFLEIHYSGALDRNARPLAFVGKGVTFDSGGISLKPAKDMKAMRADMGGAATVAVSTLAIAKSKLPINVVTTIPLTENLPGPTANKPGDVIYTMNGKTVEIDNTDAEGRLILADALYYTSSTYKPHTLVDVATLTGIDKLILHSAVMVTLSDVFSGVFTNSDDLWNELNTAGEAEFDRMWRLPLDEEFGPQIRSSNADLCNTGGTWGGSCTAALFLKEFVDGADSSNADAIRWAHIDIGGTMEALRAGPYTPAGMTGRPTRKNTHGIPTSRQNQPNQNRERRQRQQQQHNNNNNNNNNINHNNQHRLPNSSDNVDLPPAPFSRNLRSFLPLSSTALPPVVTGAGAGGTSITLASGAGVGGRRRPLSLGSPHTVSASGRNILSAHGDGGSVDEECIISAHWCDVEDLGNINHTRGSSSRWLVIVYASGVQIWDTSNLSSVREVVNLRNDTMHIQGPVLNATILPAPSDDVSDQFTNTRPLIGVLTSSQFTVYSLPTQSVVEQISFSDATQFVARPSFIVITSIHPSTLHILSASSLSTLHTIHLPTSIYPSTALSLRLLAYTSPPPPNLHLYNSQSTRNNSTFISRDSQRRERGERYFISSNSLRDSIGTSVARVGGEVWSGMKALAAASPINIGDKSGSGGLSGSIGAASSITDDTHWGYSKSAPATTMSAASLAPNTDPNSPSSLTTSGANWITVLDLKPLLNGELPRVVSRFAPFSSDSTSRGEISKLWFGAGGGTGAAPMLCVAPREGQRVSVFQIRLSRRIFNARSDRSGIGSDSTKPNSASPETNINDEAKLEMPLHWYDLRRGLTSAKVENVTWDRAGKWVGISTARRTVHIFAPNPYGGKTDRQAHFQTNVPNAEQLQPLSTELSPVVRLRPFEGPRSPSNTPANNTLEHNASLSSLSFIFLPASISNTLPLSLLPHSSISSHSSSPASSLPRLSSSSSPQLHAAPPKRPFQDILVFDSNIGEMVLYRVALEWTSQGSTVSMEQGASVSSGGYGNTSGYSFSFPASGVTKKVATSGISTVTVPQEEGYLIGKDSVLATWNLKRAKDWPEVKDGYLFEKTSPVIAFEKKKDFSE
ncbi:hypothetical protein Clacol_009093 [Clathrus columnatus]|uniref:Cytosol aminopeptidase domain-containing protein n=1 Tax=Clathrus columnatus TaxID=1419009 RepID=A0AAV5APS3_9AGAM|nr:hypothetical protein Clacol_009093 [Clathrus columnatus]